MYLFNAKEDTDLLVRHWRRTFKLLPTEKENEAEYQLNIEKLFVPNSENLNAEPIYDYSFKHFILDKIRGRESELLSKENIVFYNLPSISWQTILVMMLFLAMFISINIFSTRKQIKKIAKGK